MNFKYVLVIVSILLFGMSKRSIPDNAYEANEHPGWICKEGFVQKRNSCIKVDIPKHAILNEDGHTWSCTEGFEKYRDKCKKNKNFKQLIKNDSLEGKDKDQALDQEQINE